MTEPRRQRTGAAPRGDGEANTRAAKARRNAWLLAGFAVLVYVGYMLWFMIRGGG